MTAEERINALIARAGSPVMVVRNTQEDAAEQYVGSLEALKPIIEEKYGGNVVAYIGHLVDTIDRLEAALHNVIGERDQLLADLRKMTCDIYGCDTCASYACDFCMHKNKSYAECDECDPKNDHWEWRGVPDKEEQE